MTQRALPLLMLLATVSPTDAAAATELADEPTAVTTRQTSAEPACAAEPAGQPIAAADTCRPAKHNTLFRRIGRAFTSVFREFNHVDTTYIERQRYNYAVMLQHTTTYETYKLKSTSGQSVKFAPEPSNRIGPYVGWRWVFLGYTLDVNHLNNGSKRKEYDLSLYSSLLGIDFYYRKTGNDYHITETTLDDYYDADLLDGTDFDGLHASIKGIDIYYIFNHRKFSYPAAYSQSTVQRRSAGSFMTGIGYTRHEISFDYQALQDVVSQRISQATGSEATDYELDDGLNFGQLHYTSFTLSAGYGYNWVFARNCLLNATLSLGLSYKTSSSSLLSESRSMSDDFSFHNLNVDGTGRFGLVWNNSKYFVGASALVHSYNYKKSPLAVNSMFGNFYVYAGFNFGKR